MADAPLLAPLLAPVAALGAALATGAVRRDALRRGVLDTPNARSSHVRPTPRGGGAGLLLGVAAALGAIRGVPGSIAAWCAVLAVGLVAAVGWVDDHRGAPVRVRLAIHVAAGLLLLPLARTAGFGMPHAPSLALPFVALLAGWWVFWTISAINVVNFIDGIDGLIGAQALVFGLHLALLGEPGGAARAVGLALAGASAGFLAWNWAPARIFLGDVGSGALGVLAVAGGLLLLREGRAGFVATFAPLMPIFLDAAVTLARRARRGARLSEAHREHLYQRLANGGLGHAPVSAAYAAASLLAAGIAAFAPQRGVGVLVAALLPLLVLGGIADRAATRSSSAR